MNYKKIVKILSILNIRTYNCNFDKIPSFKKKLFYDDEIPGENQKVFMEILI